MLHKSQRVLALVTEGHDGAVFSNEAGAEEPEDVTTLTLPREDWVEFGELQQLTVTIEPGDTLNELPYNPGREVWEKGPHSRACGARKHPHGRECHNNCPTCEGHE